MFIVYMLRTSAGTLYTGYTIDLEKRLQHHREKKVGAKYLRAFDSFELVHTETFAMRSEAMKREAAIKKLTKTEKEELIKEASPPALA